MVNMYQIANLLKEYDYGNVDLEYVDDMFRSWGLDVEVEELSHYLGDGITANTDLTGVNGTCLLDVGVGKPDRCTVVDDVVQGFNTGVGYSQVMVGKFIFEVDGSKLGKLVGMVKEK